MRRIVVFVSMLLAVSSLSVGGASALSSGCDEFNRADLDDQYISRDVGVLLEAGEVLSFSADSPVSGEGLIGISLRVGPFGTAPQDLVEVDSADFPGSVSHVVPSDGEYRVLWTTQSNSPEPVAATWNVSCGLPDEQPDINGWNAGQCVKLGVIDRAADPKEGAGPGVIVNDAFKGPFLKGNGPFNQFTVCAKTG